MVLPGACSPSRSVVSKMTTSRTMSSPGVRKQNAADLGIRGVCLRVLLGSASQVDTGQHAAIPGSSNQDQEQDQQQVQQQTRKREGQLHGRDATRGAEQCQVGWGGQASTRSP